MIALVLLLISAVHSQTVCDGSNRVDCGYSGINQQQCESAGCCWDPVNPNPGNLPWCFFKSGPPSHYYIDTIVPITGGYQATLKLNDSSSTSSLPTLLATVTFENENRFHLLITDPANPYRWQIPNSWVPAPGVEPYSGNLAYSFSYVKDPATFIITRNSDGQVVLNTSDLHFEDTYLAISTSVEPTGKPLIYGIGEHVDPFQLPSNDHSYTLFAADIPTPYDQNLYGAHPFYLEHRSNGKSNAIFMRNSNGMDIFVHADKVTFKMNGGVIDLYGFAGGAPEQTIQQYHQLIGKPYLPPYWSLGWHQCRYGYPNLAALQNVVAQYASHGIPLDTMWSDIDYMNAYEDFSWDPVNYPQSSMNSFANQLHSNGQQYVTIVDPGIHNRQGYNAYDTGLQQGVFILDKNNATYIGTVWPGSTAYPDFFNPKTPAWWQDQLATFLAGVPVDGIWIDMNEPSNFNNGAELNNDTVLEKEYILKLFQKAVPKTPKLEEEAPLGDVNNPTYKINNFNSHAALNTKTIAMDSQQFPSTGVVQHYNVHNMYGHSEAIATHNALKAIQKRRPFVLSRSTFASSGRYTAHWLGDNHSQFSDMKYSIAGILDFNLFGVPFTGADICGFMGDTTEELCCRWSALGAFYPFSRNHNGKGQIDQEPYNWASVTRVAIKTLNARYSLLPYYYTLFSNASVSGGTVARPLFFEFPTDTTTYAIDTQFLIGPGLLVSPVLDQGATSVNAYFPNAKWYSFWDGTPLGKTGYVSLYTPMEDIQVHVRGGVIFPMQYPDMTTAATRKKPYILLVALDDNYNANGFAYLDDGISVDTSQNTTITYSASKGMLKATVLQNSQTVQPPNLGNITILGAPAVNTVTINGASVSYTYDSSRSKLTIANLVVSMTQGFTLLWS